MMNSTTKMNGLLSSYNLLSHEEIKKKQMEQVIKIFSMRKLVAYRIGRQLWCKTEGNKGLIRVIVLFFPHL